MSLISRNSRENQQKRERAGIEYRARELGDTPVPAFAYGADWLGLPGKDEAHEVHEFVNTWLDNPAHFLNYRDVFRHTDADQMSVDLVGGESCYSFSSYLHPEDKAKFYESPQPIYGRGEKVAFIILPHWNGDFDKYRRGASIIRHYFLPVATYRYFPAYATEGEYKNKTRFDVIGPNIGLTISRVQQDVLNIQHFAHFLKSELGYEKVGIWSYSIGSPKSYLAAMFSNGLIDFLLMHFLAYSFPRAILHGIATKPIAHEILRHISEDEASRLFSVLSPGTYTDFMAHLPRNSRLVQANYDLVFGEENNKKMIEVFKENAPFVNLECGDFGHMTFSEIDKVIAPTYRNGRFVMNNSKLRFF